MLRQRQRQSRSQRHGLLLLIAIGGLVMGLLVACSGQPPANDAASPPDQPSIAAGSLDKTSPPPWLVPANVTGLVAEAGLDLGPMGVAEHYHPQLQLVIDGQPVPVAANIGVDPATGAMSALHTHDPSGVIHIEADQTGEVFTLGQLFTEWGLLFTSRQIGGVRATSGHAMEVTVNGHSYDGDPASLHLAPGQQIVIRLG